MAVMGSDGRDSGCCDSATLGASKNAAAARALVSDAFFTFLTDLAEAMLATLAFAGMKQPMVGGHGELARLSRSKLHKVLAQGELKPHKIRYYVERRDPEFAQKMAAVLHVYKEVEILNQGLVTGRFTNPGR